MANTPSLARARRERNLQAGNCANCNKPRDCHSTRFCLACLKKIYAANYARRERNIKHGKCVTCSKRLAKPPSHQCVPCKKRGGLHVKNHKARAQQGMARKYTFQYIDPKDRKYKYGPPGTDIWSRFGEEILRRREQGETFTQIAEAIGAHPTTVQVATWKHFHPKKKPTP